MDEPQFGILIQFPEPIMNLFVDRKYTDSVGLYMFVIHDVFNIRIDFGVQLKVVLYGSFYE